LARPVQPGRKTHIIDIEPGDTTGRNFAVAMDIGTTTVYGQLIDLVSGHVLAEHAEFNGQISYGEDVITRIVYAEKGNGLEKLQSVVVETINSVLDRIVKRSGVERDEINTITIAGNTTMTQLLLKINPRYIRRSPYVPASTLYPPVNARDLGIALADHVSALVYPAVSSYVGGDIVAGVMGSGLYRSEAITLYMDVGTNAEIVIGNQDWMACAACSAGPAFEGGGIEFGMRAAKGAIEDFSIDPSTYEPMNLTIGDVRPKGIAGSGLITIVAVLFESGVIDNRGKFNRELGTDRIRKRDGVWEYVLASAENTQIDRDITISEVDIDNLLRAKGAIYSGCQTLLEEVGLSVGDLDRIILAGGFGSYIDLEKAMTIGLLPEIDPEKITYIGNGSLMGARMSSLSNHIRRDVVEVLRKMTNFELSETGSYMDHYVAALFLPHTEVNLFPKLKARMEARRSSAAP
ncbi:MAG: ASKHA domain-containing protein, partial [Desulfobacterales bacterium]|nr:ASKHA domain-containing protein [Desulfobacterales bacterium]